MVSQAAVMVAFDFNDQSCFAKERGTRRPDLSRLLVSLSPSLLVFLNRFCTGH